MPPASVRMAHASSARVRARWYCWGTRGSFGTSGLLVAPNSRTGKLGSAYSASAARWRRHDWVQRVHSGALAMLPCSPTNAFLSWVQHLQPAASCSWRVDAPPEATSCAANSAAVSPSGTGRVSNWAGGVQECSSAVEPRSKVAALGTNRSLTMMLSGPAAASPPSGAAVACACARAGGGGPQPLPLLRGLHARHPPPAIFHLQQPLPRCQQAD